MENIVRPTNVEAGYNFVGFLTTKTAVFEEGGVKQIWVVAEPNDKTYGFYFDGKFWTYHNNLREEKC